MANDQYSLYSREVQTSKEYQTYHKGVDRSPYKNDYLALDVVEVPSMPQKYVCQHLQSSRCCTARYCSHTLLRGSRWMDLSFLPSVSVLRPGELLIHPKRTDSGATTVIVTTTSTVLVSPSMDSSLSLMPSTSASSMALSSITNTGSLSTASYTASSSSSSSPRTVTGTSSTSSLTATFSSSAAIGSSSTSMSSAQAESTSKTQLPLMTAPSPSSFSSTTSFVTSSPTSSSSSTTSFSPPTLQPTSSDSASSTQTSQASSTLLSVTTAAASSASFSSVAMSSSASRAAPSPTRDAGDWDSRRDAAIIVGSILGTLVLLVAVFAVWWARRRAARRANSTIDRDTLAAEGDGLLERAKLSLMNISRHASVASSSAYSNMDLRIQRVSLPASIFSPLVVQSSPYAVVVPPTAELLSPTPARHSWTNRRSIISPSSPLPSPCSAASLTSLLNANWPAVPPTIVVPEQASAPRDSFGLTDESRASDAQEGQPLGQTRSSTTFSAFGSGVTGTGEQLTRRQAEDGGVRLAGGPPATAPRRHPTHAILRTGLCIPWKRRTEGSIKAAY
ncbi:hypothetical protein DAEQUDRAFT_105024 [Daedalea quercina L-15889]|uniref:Uncharacterized protein n=1 Tax=Daedalea quercina L-15889 TaxID=1314783 RepID=A0A165KUE3_9APHY|nr:hypothetical protein DAEQUDRAFT_105024 [Daedalea quercina L-15889]